MVPILPKNLLKKIKDGEDVIIEITPAVRAILPRGLINRRGKHAARFTAGRVDGSQDRIEEYIRDMRRGSYAGYTIYQPVFETITIKE